MPFDGIDFDPVVRVLLSGKNIVQTRGLRRKSIGEIGDRRCVIGAIQEAAGVDGRATRWIDGRDEVAWLAGECYGYAVGAERVEPWTDDERTTLEEVLAGFDLAVERRLMAIVQLAEVRRVP